MRRTPQTAEPLRQPQPAAQRQLAAAGSAAAALFDTSPRALTQRQAIAASFGAVAQLNPDKTLALGFSDLRNQTYGQDDAFGQRPENPGMLAKYREATHAMGPEAMGINQQADPTGAIQPQFTAGIKAAMASAKTIKQNLAGFTAAQIQFAFNHRPELDANEITLLKNHHPDFGRTMMHGLIVEKNVTGQDGAEWFAMKDLLVDPTDRTSGRHAQAWPAWQAPISVWELSHHLHNQNLFNKTEFEYFDTHYAHVRLSANELQNMGVTLNVGDLLSDEQLNVVPPESAFASFAKWANSFF